MKRASEIDLYRANGAGRPMGRRRFVKMATEAALVGGVLAMTPGHVGPGRSRSNFQIVEATIDSIHAAIRSGELTVLELADLHLQRINTLNPSLHALIETNPDAREIARELDERRRRTGRMGAMHGIPVVVKNVMETGDRMEASAGQFALMGGRRQPEAEVVRRVRAAEGVVIGTANLSAYAGGLVPAPVGWSARGGLTVNPHADGKSAGGSSAGCGAALDASLGVVAIGTDTTGSNLYPGGVMDVVAMKTTLGLVSARGVFPVAPSMDTVGPLARNVRDAATLLNVLAGSGVDYLEGLDKGIRGMRLGIVQEADPHPARDLFEGAVEDLMGLGAELVDVQLPILTDEMAEPLNTVLFFEFKKSMDEIDRWKPGLRIHSLADLMEYNRQHASGEMPYGQLVLEMTEKLGNMSLGKYEKALAQMRSTARLAQNALERVDALIGYGFGPAEDALKPLTIGGTGRLWASMLGGPAVTVSMGHVNDLPAGLLIFGRHQSDAALLRCAAAYEKGTHHRKPPPLHLRQYSKLRAP